MSGRRSESPRRVPAADFVQAAMIAANIFPFLQTPERENGGGVIEPNDAGVYHDEEIRAPITDDTPLLGLSTPELNDINNDSVNQLMGDIDIGDIIDPPIFLYENISEASASNMSPTKSDGGKITTPKRVFADHDSDSDFAEPRPKSRSVAVPNTPRIPDAVIAVGGQGKGMKNIRRDVEATPSTSRGVRKASSDSGSHNGSSVLRAMLSTECTSSAANNNKKQLNKEKKVAKRQVKKRSVDAKPRVQKKQKITGATSTTITVEAGCSSTLPKAPKKAAQTPIYSLDDSDSESEFEIFSQPDERNIIKTFNKIRRQVQKEFETLEKDLQGSTDRMNEADRDLREIGADLEVQRAELERKRAEFELQRTAVQLLENRMAASTEVSERSRSEVVAKSAALEKVRKKRRMIEKNLL